MATRAYIAYRGNYSGRHIELENTKHYLINAIENGFWTHCDVRYSNGELYFNGVSQTSLVDFRIPIHENVICQAHDENALVVLENMGAHYFYGSNARISLTSKGFMWCAPSVRFEHPKAIWLMDDNEPMPDLDVNIFGVCANNLYK